MNARRWLICASLLTLATAATMLAQAQAPVRDVAKTPTGTATISGVVMSDASPSRPVRRVLVSLGSGGVIKVPISAITDDNGAFTFTNLPAGTYTLTAARPAYVTTAYRSTTPGRGSGVPISLAAGQQLTGIELKILRGSVIAGTVRDPSGKPATDVEMVMLNVQSLAGRRKVTPVLQSASLDRRGEYRFYGLAPGDYIIRAQPTPRLGNGDLRPTTAAEIEWARQAAATQNTGAAGAVAEAPAPPPTGRPIAYAATYYPGTADVAAATVVTVGPNEERIGVDFSTALVPVASISGQVTGPDGLPPNGAQVTLQPTGTGGVSFIDTIIGMAVGSSSIRVGQDGRLSGSGIAPGRYRLTVRGMPGGANSRASLPEARGMGGAAGALAGMFAGAAGAPATLWATTDLDIDGRDITDIDLRLQPGMSISGTIAFEGEDPAAPVDAAGVSVQLTTMNREAKSAIELLAGMFQGTTGRGSKDRTFTVNGLAPDTYRASFQPPGVFSPLLSPVGTGGWVLKSAMLDGRDLSDIPVDIRPGEDIKGVVVTFTKVSAQITGRVQDGAGQPVAGFPIVVFPSDRALWMAGSRRIIAAKPSSNGDYKILGLPSGEYYLCAVTQLDPNDLYDAGYLDQLVAGAFKVSLGEGEKKVQDLRLGGGGQ